jgi:hypothetical protein
VIPKDGLDGERIPAVGGSVLVVRDQGQDYYNGQLSHFFRMWQWATECRVISELPLKADFMKDDVVVEVEFGNARTYYQDYVKFMLAHHARLAEIGVLIVPTEDFARHLCGVGRPCRSCCCGGNWNPFGLAACRT